MCIVPKMLDVFELVLHIVENIQMISVITLMLAFITRRTQPRLAAFFLLWLPAIISVLTLLLALITQHTHPRLSSFFMFWLFVMDALTLAILPLWVRIRHEIYMY